MVYRNEYTAEISFPLGGIGTGCIGLAGNGRLIDWEIYNKPNKGSLNGLSHFAVRAEEDGRVIDARVLNGDLPGPYTGGGTAAFSGFGFGTSRCNLAGVPHFKDVEFDGEFPVAKLNFLDGTFPGNVAMTAFNPFIPLNDRDSTIPGAFFAIDVTNPTDRNLTYTVCMSLCNPLHHSGSINQYTSSNGLHTVTLKSGSLKPHETKYGDLTVATDAEDVSFQEYWYRGGWFDSLEVFWRDFNSAGKLKKRSYPYDRSKDGTHHYEDTCSLAAHFSLAAGESKTVRFVVSWNFPNTYAYWRGDAYRPDESGEESGQGCSSGDACCCSSKVKKTWKNYYAVLFKDSAESAAYSLQNWERLYRETVLFKDALFASTMPEAAISAVSANISILKSPTCLRLEDGSFYGWEGCSCESGCCDGSCTHVWNYAYALPFLFPALERSMRDLDYKYNCREDGGMAFRLQLPTGSEMWDFRPCVDGQFGNIIKTYRDWKICGDTDWLREKWDKIKKAIEFAWSEENVDCWDRDKDGVLEGRQHHTLDMELFGPSSWLNGMYLAALKAGAEMAAALGEKETADEYMEIFYKGKQFVEAELFTGEYFMQKIDLNDKSLVERFSEGNSVTGYSALEAYWNDESGEIKYQIGEGSAIDQLLAQWHANICGLGEIFDKEKTVTALKSIIKYNYKDSMRNVFNPCRIYALNDEAGTLLCEWPDGTYKPITPAPYCEEVWPGLEYQAGSHMIQEGLVEEGMKIVTALRNRFDGKVRNPWNEYECGSNYARSMSSYALLNAFSGFSFDMTKGMIGFNPPEKRDEYKFFFSLDSGWGLVSRSKNEYRIEVLYGSLALNCVCLPIDNVKSVELDGAPVKHSFENDALVFAENVELLQGKTLLVVAKQ